MDRPEMLLAYQTAAGSIIADCFTFGTLFGGFWINYKYMGNGIVLQLVMGICFFICAAARGNKKVKRLNLKDAIEYLQAKDVDHAKAKRGAG